MAQPFSFGFSNDDIENDNDSEETMDVEEPLSNIEATEPVESKLVQPRRHTLQELLSTLPSKISYSTLQITADNGHSISIPRRELFDIRAQIMAEDTGGNTALIAGLSTDDITPSVYEGGLKTWECSVDLARCLLNEYGNEEGLRGEDVHVIELGAGTALPTITLLHLVLAQSTTPASQPHIHLTLTDYNLHVLRLATIPNLLLTWASHTGLLGPSEGDLDITLELLENFLQALHAKTIFVDAVSGSWGQAFSFLSQERASHFPGSTTLVLASETIYSPASIQMFTNTLLALLSSPPATALPQPQSGSLPMIGNDAASRAETARALVAAKRVYFGVGGGVDEFLIVLRSTTGVAREVWETHGEGAGVGRVVLEVRRGL